MMFVRFLMVTIVVGVISFVNKTTLVSSSCFLDIGVPSMIFLAYMSKVAFCTSNTLAVLLAVITHFGMIQCTILCSAFTCFYYFDTELRMGVLALLISIPAHTSHPKYTGPWSLFWLFLLFLCLFLNIGSIWWFMFLCLFLYIGSIW